MTFEPTLVLLPFALAFAFLDRWSLAEKAVWGLASLLALRLILEREKVSQLSVGFEMPLFVVLCTASLTWNDDPRHSWPAVATVLAYATISLYCVAFLTPFESLIAVSAGALITAIASAAALVADPALTTPDSTGAVRGIFAAKNWLALAMGCLVIVIVLSPLWRSPLWKSALICGLAFLVVARSDGAWVAIGSAAAFSISRMLFPRLNRQTRRLLGITGLSAIAFGIYITVHRIFRVIDSFGKETSARTRLTLWQVEMHEFFRKPLFGWGFRGSWDRFHGIIVEIVQLSGGFPARSGHDSYVDLLFQLGVVGTCLFAIMAVRALGTLRYSTIGAVWAGMTLFILVYSLVESFVLGHVGLLLVMIASIYACNSEKFQDDKRGHQALLAIVLRPANK